MLHDGLPRQCFIVIFLFYYCWPMLLQIQRVLPCCHKLCANTATVLILQASVVQLVNLGSEVVH